MTQAGLDGHGALRPERTGVIIGSGIGGMQTFEEQCTTSTSPRGRTGSPRSSFRCSSRTSPPGWSPSATALKGPNYATVSACASSAHAIGDAFTLIQHGEADAMVTGGAEATITGLTVAAFANMKALSSRNDSPETASRPFDPDRDGFVMGDGGGDRDAREPPSTPKRRGARILGEVAGLRRDRRRLPHHVAAPRRRRCPARHARVPGRRRASIRPTSTTSTRTAPPRRRATSRRPRR